MLVAAAADAAVGAVHAFAQVAACAVCHERQVGRGSEGEEPSLEATGGGLLAGGVAHGLGQTVEVGGVGKVQRPVVLVGQCVLPKVQFQLAQLLFVVPVAVGSFTLEGYAVAHEALQGVLQQSPLLGTSEVVGLLGDPLHAVVQATVGHHTHAEACDFGLHAHHHLLQRFAGAALVEVRHDGAHAVEPERGGLQGLDGVGECRRFGVGGYGLDVAFGLGDGGGDGGLVVLGVNLVEWGQLPLL